MTSKIAIARGIAQDFMEYSGRRAWTAAALILGSSVLEGASLVMLIPIVTIILEGVDTAVAPYLDGVFATVGIETIEAKLGSVLALFALLSTLRLMLIFHREVLLASLETGFVADKRRQIFTLIATRSWATAMQIEQGKFAHIIGRDLDRATAAAPIWLRLFQLSIHFVVQLTLALLLSPLITVAVLIVGVAIFFLLRPIRRRAGDLGRSLTNSDYHLFSSTGEFLRGLKPAKAHGLEQSYLARLVSAANEYRVQTVFFRRDLALTTALIQGLSILLALAVVMAGYFWIGVEPAVLIVVLIILIRMASPLQQMQLLLQSALHQATAYTSAMSELAKLDDEDGTPAVERADPLNTAPGFRMEGIGWTPPGTHSPVLSGIDATVPAGQITAISGKSGAGKSTLCDLLVGLLTPDQGVVMIDGAPLTRSQITRLQASLAYVGQDGSLLQPTVRDLLLWGTEAIDEGQIWSALECVGIADLVRAEPAGLDTELKGEVSRFSGGERQRLRLARALLRQPKLIVLDEATNALDPEAEHEVLGAFLKTRGDATVIMVSHRADTQAIADHVINLDA